MRNDEYRITHAWLNHVSKDCETWETEIIGSLKRIVDEHQSEFGTSDKPSMGPIPQMVTQKAIDLFYNSNTHLKALDEKNCVRDQAL